MMNKKINYLDTLFSMRSKDTTDILRTSVKQTEEKNCNNAIECTVCNTLSSVYYAVVSIVALTDILNGVLDNIPLFAKKQATIGYICPKCVIHTTIKPKHILLDNNWERYRPKLVPANAGKWNEYATMKNDWTFDTFKKLPESKRNRKARLGY